MTPIRFDWERATDPQVLDPAQSTHIVHPQTVPLTGPVDELRLRLLDEILGRWESEVRGQRWRRAQRVGQNVEVTWTRIPQPGDGQELQQYPLQAAEAVDRQAAQNEAQTSTMPSTAAPNSTAGTPPPSARAMNCVHRRPPTEPSASASAPTRRANPRPLLQNLRRRRGVRAVGFAMCSAGSG